MFVGISVRETPNRPHRPLYTLAASSLHWHAGGVANETCEDAKPFMSRLLKWPFSSWRRRQREEPSGAKSSYFTLGHVDG